MLMMAPRCVLCVLFCPFSTSLIAYFCCDASVVDSFDIVIQKIGGKIFLDTRANSAADLLSVNETAAEPPKPEVVCLSRRQTASQPCPFVDPGRHQRARSVVARSDASQSELCSSEPVARRASPPSSPLYRMTSRFISFCRARRSCWVRRGRRSRSSSPTILPRRARPPNCPTSLAIAIAYVVGVVCVSSSRPTALSSAAFSRRRLYARDARPSRRLHIGRRRAGGRRRRRHRRALRRARAQRVCAGERQRLAPQARRDARRRARRRAQGSLRNQ